MLHNNQKQEYNYEYLDSDTQKIIDAMVFNTGKTKEKAILALVEFGMLSMIASVHPKKEKIMEHVYEAIRKDEKLKATAEAYNGYWSLDV